jgi:hypothetical protein
MKKFLSLVFAGLLFLTACAPLATRESVYQTEISTDWQADSYQKYASLMDVSQYICDQLSQAVLAYAIGMSGDKEFPTEAYNDFMEMAKSIDYAQYLIHKAQTYEAEDRLDDAEALLPMIKSELQRAIEFYQKGKTIADKYWADKNAKKNSI